MKRFLTVMAALCAASPAFAGDLTFSCAFNQGSMHQECSAQPLAILPKLEIQADVTINYVFDCRGHQTGLAFTSDVSQKPLTYGTDASQQVVISGQGPFALQDLAATDTYRATLVGDCTVKILSTLTTPAQSQLDQWQKDAAADTVNIANALDAWLTARNLDAILNFDNSQFAQVTQGLQATITNMEAEVGLEWSDMINPATGDFWNANVPAEAANIPDAWETLLQSESTLPQLVLLYNYSLDALDGRPSLVSKADAITAAGVAQPLQAARFLTKLKTQMTIGNTLVAESQKYLATLSTDLLNLSNAIASDLKTYPALATK